MSGGRGAWSSIGGTLNAKGTAPGPYYVLAAPNVHLVGSAGHNAPELNDRAVAYGVRSIQRAINRELYVHIDVDGRFGLVTKAMAMRFQEQAGIGADGIVGPITCRELFRLDAQRYATTDVPACVLMGLMTHESGIDPGAVGYVDSHDLGLAQINGPANPDMTESMRFTPLIAIDYIVRRVESSLRDFPNLRDAIASYNLGGGGARSWIAHGRPDIITYYPTPVNVKDYIDKVLIEC